MGMLGKSQMLKSLRAQQNAYKALVQMFTAFGNHAKTLGNEKYAEGFRILGVAIQERAIRFSFCDRKFLFLLEIEDPVAITENDQILTGKVVFSEVFTEVKGESEVERLHSLVEFTLDSQGITDQWESQSVRVMVSDARSTETFILYCLHQAIFPGTQRATNNSDLEKQT